MVKGRVTKFNEGSSFGFIEIEGQTKSVFVHLNDVVEKDVRLKEGDIVKFRLEENEKGLNAKDVIVVVD